VLETRTGGSGRIFPVPIDGVPVGISSVLAWVRCMIRRIWKGRYDAAVSQESSEYP